MKNSGLRMHNRRSWPRFTLRGAFIVTGSVVQGFAMGVFLFPHSIPSGGVAGLAVLLNHWLHLPVSIGLWLTNMLFIVTSVHYLGKISALGTIFAITATSVSVNFFERFVDSPFYSVWTDLLFGAIILGTGVSILLKQRVANGGIGFAALAIAKSRQTDPAKILFWLNGSIIVLTAYVIDWMIIVQAVLCQWISTKIVSWLYNASFPPKPTYTAAWRHKND